MPTPSTETVPRDDTPAALRNRLADQLAAAGQIRTPAVEAAFRTVPRHAFAPEATPETAYADDIIPTRHAPDGRVLSSVSAPWLQADMLESARVKPGHRVLEIGSGGYNAALIAELVGPTGAVTTVDIDPAVTERATRLLHDTGYDRVRVVTADAEHLPPDVVPADGFDAVIVTVETWDLPWIDVVTEGGRLVVPLRIHGYVWSIGFTKRDGVLVSDEPLTVCGFVPMRGVGAWTTIRRAVPGHEVHLAWEDGTPQPVDQLASAFDRPPTEVRTNVTVGGQEPFDDLQLYLAGMLPGFCRLSIDPDRATGVISPPPPPHWPAAATLQGDSLARLATDRVGEDERSEGVHEFVIHGYGPAAERIATDMAEHVRRWQRNHRAAGYPRITVSPRTGASVTTAAALTIEKKHTHLTLEWPVVPGTAALLTNDEGQYLLHLRSANKPIWRPGHWAFLGGNTERGESCDEAITRELREETGLTIPDLTPFITLDTEEPNGAFTDRVLVYLGTLNRPAHEIPLHEGIQLRWTHAAETAEMTMDPGTAAVIRAHQRHPHPRLDTNGKPPTLRVQNKREHRGRSIVGAHLVLLRDGAVLLGKRHPDSAFAPSTWHLPAGHREQGESPLACMVRETAEETGLTIEESDLSLVHTLDLRDPGSPIPRMQLFFSASRWSGEPRVLEPDRCTQWRWWPLDALPEQLVAYTRTALAAIARKEPYSQMGWTT